MMQVSIGQVENLDELVRGLLSLREALESACREQVAVAECKLTEAREETQNSENLLESAFQQVQVTQLAFEAAQQNLASSRCELSAAYSAMHACFEERERDCSTEKADVSDAKATVDQAQVELEQTHAELVLAKENYLLMERRVECAKQAFSMAEQSLERSKRECELRFAAVTQSVDVAIERLTAAHQALNAYLATNLSAAQFQSWLNWTPTQQSDRITPDTLRDRINLCKEQRRLLQEYLYDRNPTYRGLVDKYRSEWVAAKGDAERNIVARKTRIHLSGEFAEQVARYSLAPLGGRIETQGRTFVGDNGRYTKTDLLVIGLRVPVILGRGENMGAPVGGSMAFEVKCGKSDYLYSQKDHMVFQAEGHKKANARCTLCSRDIHDLPPEKEQELRDTLREAGSPLVGMLPRKNEIDQSCLAFIRPSEEEKL